MRILVVEDEALIGLLLAEVLTDLGHDVCGVEVTEAGAVAAAARCRPDLMIVDVWLADGNGISAIAEILRAGPMPHFFVSGDVASVRGLKPDAQVVQKPFREQELVLAIARALSAPAPIKGTPAARQ
jgi:two-component system, response regulator PdtaR